MTERYSFFDAKQTSDGYDRTYNASDVARYFSSFVGNGVYANPASSLQVTSSSSGMRVEVKPGKAWINGYYYELSDSNLVLNLAASDTSYDRIDAVALRLDLNNREIHPVVVKGSASSNPSLPSIQTPNQNNAISELLLASIRVRKGAVSIAASDITDYRPDKTKCGYVHQVVDQIDTTKLFAQYDDEFNTWFDSIKDLTSTNDTTKLADEVTNLDAKVKDLDGKVTSVSGVVPINRGGTGAVRADLAMRNLRGWQFVPLYNSDGTQDNITLSDSITNYDGVLITYEGDTQNVQSSQFVMRKSKKWTTSDTVKVNLTTTTYSTNSSAWWQEMEIIAIQDKTITRNIDNFNIAFYPGSNNYGATLGGENSKVINISNVFGIKTNL